MEFAFSIDAIVRYFFDRSVAEREKVAVYLEATAKDAQALANYWGSRLAECQSIEAEDGDNASGRSFVAFSGSANFPQFTSLRIVYRDATLAFDGRLEPMLQELFVGHVARLLLHREEAADAFGEVAQELRARRLLSREGAGVDIPRSSRLFAQKDEVDVESLEILVRVLHEEAAELDGLARRYRAAL